MGSKKPAMKQIQLRAPKPVLEWVQRVAKLADVTPTQVYRVLLAVHIAKSAQSGDSLPEEKR